MPTYYTPGVYVEEISTLPPSVAEVATAVPAFVGYITRFQIQPEERVLHRLFGDAYGQYTSRVRRWL